MSELIKAEPEEKVAIRELRNMGESKGRRFAALLQRAYRPNPDIKDIQQLKKWLDEYPEIWRLVFDMSHVIENNLVMRIFPEPAAQLALNKNLEILRQGMEYEAATLLEKSLIDNVILSWLQCQWAEYKNLILVGSRDISPATVEFWERRLSRAQGRYLRACESLAKVRKLMARHPALQVKYRV